MLLLLFLGLAAGQRLSKSESLDVASKCGLSQENRLKAGSPDLSEITEKPRLQFNVLRGSVPRSLDDAPTAVEIGIKDYRGFVGHRCSGTLISPRHVVTAGHCVRNLTVNCRTGQTKFSPGELYAVVQNYCILADYSDCYRNNDQVIRKVKMIYAPIDYLCNRSDSDIAVFELDKNVPLTDEDAYACLATSSLKNGQSVTLAGYGDDLDHDPSQPQSGLLKTYTTQVTRCTRPNAAPDHVCMQNNNQQYACAGDSGAGYTFNQNGRITLGAVLVSGLECELVVDYQRFFKFLPPQDVATNVVNYLSFICDVSGVCPRKSDFQRVYGNN